MEALQVLQEGVQQVLEVHLLLEEVLHHQEELLLLIEEVQILEVTTLHIEDHHLTPIIEHQLHQVEAQGHPLQIQEVVLHLQEVLEQVVLVEDHLLHHHLEEEINIIFKRKFQKI